MALLSKSSRKLILYFCHLNLFREAGHPRNGRNWLITQFIPSSILCVRVRSNHHSNHVHRGHHSGQDRSSTRDRLQLQQRAQPQRTSSCVPKRICVQDHARSSHQVRIRSVRVLRRVQFYSTATGQPQQQEQEQLQRWVQHQLPSSCVPTSIHHVRIRSRGRILCCIHGLVLHSNHHNTTRGQHWDQQQR